MLTRSIFNNHILQKVVFFSKAILIGLFGIFTAVALLSYDPQDRSFNRASDNPINNLAGIYGSYIADPALQFLGVASIFLSLIPIVWSIRLITRKKISFFWVRFITFLALLILSSAILAYFPAPKTWLFNSLGGFIGLFVKERLSDLLSNYVFLSSAIIVFIISFALTADISYHEIKLFTLFLMKLQLGIYLFAKLFFKKLFNLIYKKKENNYIEDDLDNEYAGVNSFNDVMDKIEEENIEEVERILNKVNPFKKKIDKIAEEKPRKVQVMHREEGAPYELPNITLLKPMLNIKKNNLSDSVLKENSRKLEQVLEDFGVYGKISRYHPGPVVTLYELEPSAGTKSSRVIGLADDIARSMSSVAARIAVVPGKNAIGIELPNSIREIVYLRELLESKEYHDENLKLPIILGKNIDGSSMVADLSRMPHLLVAGTTGSGKSVAINTMILSLLFRLTPKECKFIMIDPKMLELSVYDGIPHLLTPVVTEPSKAVVALKWVVKEMENRYKLMSNLGVRNIAGYNKALQEAIDKGEKLERTVQTGFDPETGKPIIEKVELEMEKLPFIVVIVDEMADLMIVAGKDIEGSIQRLAQMARAAGIHIIMATQRPSVDVITGVIKANFPTRISFQVTSRIDSRTILGEPGAEQLLGMGDMLYMAGGSRITRVHGTFVDDKEVENIVSYLKTQGYPTYVTDVVSEDDEDFSSVSGGANADELYDEAVQIVVRDRKASISYIQRCLKIGYNRAASIIEAMEKQGIISKANHVGKREILLPESND